jgi:hypothetical protein
VIAAVAQPRFASSGPGYTCWVASTPKDVAKEAAAERLSGDRPGRARAFLAAAVAGAAAAVLAYRFLRGEPGPVYD